MIYNKTSTVLWIHHVNYINFCAQNYNGYIKKNKRIFIKYDFLLSKGTNSIYIYMQCFYLYKMYNKTELYIIFILFWAWRVLFPILWWKQCKIWDIRVGQKCPVSTTYYTRMESLLPKHVDADAKAGGQRMCFVALFLLLFLNELSMPYRAVHTVFDGHKGKEWVVNTSLSVLLLLFVFFLCSSCLFQILCFNGTGTVLQKTKNKF